MSRLPPVDEAATQRLFGEITRSRGWVSNLLRALAHSPEGLACLQQVGHFGRYQTELTERERELAIMITGRGVPYAWTHHAPLGRQVGITDEQAAAIKASRLPEGLSSAEAALAAYCFEFTGLAGVSDTCMAELQKHYSYRQVTDISILCAYYMAMGAIIIGLQVEPEPPEILQVELDWQRKKMEEARA